MPTQSHVHTHVNASELPCRGQGQGPCTRRKQTFWVCGDHQTWVSGCEGGVESIHKKTTTRIGHYKVALLARHSPEGETRGGIYSHTAHLDEGGVGDPNAVVQLIALAPGRGATENIPTVHCGAHRLGGGAGAEINQPPPIPLPLKVTGG